MTDSESAAEGLASLPDPRFRVSDLGPAAPENVRVELRDGRIVPCELVYEGVIDGTHRWAVVTPVDVDQIKCLHADTLPAHTAVVIGGRS